MSRGGVKWKSLRSVGDLDLAFPAPDVVILSRKVHHSMIVQGDWLHSVMSETAVDGETLQEKTPESMLKPGVVDPHPCRVSVN